MKARILLLPFLLLAGSALADFTVEVDDQRGHGVPDGVVSVLGPAAPLTAAPETRVIDQRDETFVPYLEIFRPGDKVVFRNSDRIRHHVYSFAAEASFEFVLAPGQNSPPVTLARTGAIAVGCNIHDQMLAYLLVTDAPWVARSGDDGKAVLHDVPPGHYTLQVWHPRLWPGRKPETQEITIGDAGQLLEAAELRFRLKLAPDQRLREPSPY